MRVVILSALIAFLILMAVAVSAQPYPSGYSSNAASGVPQPVSPASPESLNLEIPGSSKTAVQSPPSGEIGQELMQVSTSPQASPAYGVQATAVAETRMVLPPGISASNRLFVTYSPQTIEGCPLYGWLPMWVQTTSSGPIWIYEWYPDGNLQWKYLGNAGMGWNKRWFFGDTPGWHILQYYCNGWSNYIYIYVSGAAPVAVTKPVYRPAVYYYDYDYDYGYGYGYGYRHGFPYYRPWEPHPDPGPGSMPADDPFPGIDPEPWPEDPDADLDLLPDPDPAPDPEPMPVNPWL